MTDTVLVTGGTGFVARWCIVTLLERGYRVRTTVRGTAKETSVRTAVARMTDPADRLEFVVADLLGDDGWDAAVAGCRYVLHVAASLGGDHDLIEPARGGALRVLRAATAAGVERVVLTSAANTSSPTSYAEDGVTDETLWTDPEAPGLIPYRKAKTLAEKAAWDLIETDGGTTQLTTILPGAVLGPILGPDNAGSAQIIARLLTGEMPGTPRIALEIVDVRDVADIHLRAMTAPEAAGQRFLATGESLWLADVAAILREHLGTAAAKVPTRSIPDSEVERLASADPGMRAIAPALGRRNRHTTAKAERLLGWRPRPAADTVVDCARDLIDQELV
jgi:dihydroflavonol-4-reductase